MEGLFLGGVAVESLCLARAEEWLGPGSRGNTGLVPAAGTGYVHGGGRGGNGANNGEKSQ